MKINLKNKTYVISAAADGLGFAIAKKIIKAGGKVYISDINKKKVNEINKKYKNKIYATAMDCTNPTEIKNYFHKMKSLKKIHGLINNIGIAGPTKSLENIKIEEWEETIKTNLHSHFYYTKYSIPFLKKAKKSSIINLSSTAGLYGFAQRSPYTASKWAIIGLTKTLAMELGKYKIRVNAICPGSVEGDRMKRVVDAKALLTKTKPKKVKQEFESMVSLQTFVNKEDIASMALFLLSDESQNISGQSMTVDGNTERMN
tara:strand:- start:1032 stop:1808 length:777 start_codon:yes stop_codon:yes gene_type:complete